MRLLVLTPKFKRAFRKFVKRNTDCRVVFSIERERKQIAKLLSCLISEHIMKYTSCIGICDAGGSNTFLEAASKVDNLLQNRSHYLGGYCPDLAN